MSTASDPGTGAAPLRGRAYLQFVLVLGCLIALGPLTIDMYLPAFPAMAEDLDATDSQLQLTLTGMLLGLSLGQLVVGPLSDALGRRRPLLVGLSIHALSSLVCALAPGVWVLAATRLVQGVAGASVTVTAMAMVRDRFSGKAMASLVSRLILVIGLAPIVAPSLGGAVLQVAGWRWIFGVLVVAALLVIVLAWLGLQESLPAARRPPLALGSSMATYGRLVRDVRFLALAFTGGSIMATMFTYVSGASFVLQGAFGLSESQFALVFGANGAGFVLCSQLNPVLQRRYEIVDVLTGGVMVCLVAAWSLLAVGLLGDSVPLVMVLLPLAVAVGSIGLVMPNTQALGLENHPREAGSAAAVLGCLQFGVGALVAPLVGIAGGASVLSMGVVMAALTGLAAILVWLVVRPGQRLVPGGPAVAESAGGPGSRRTPAGADDPGPGRDEVRHS